MQSNDIDRINQAIRTSVMANSEMYADIINERNKLPQLDKDGSWIHTSFSDDSHIWGDSPKKFTAERPKTNSPLFNESGEPIDVGESAAGAASEAMTREAEFAAMGGF